MCSPEDIFAIGCHGIRVTCANVVLANYINPEQVLEPEPAPVAIFTSVTSGLIECRFSHRESDFLVSRSLAIVI